MRKKYIIGGMVLVATAAAVVTISANGIAGNMTSDITSSSNIAYETMMEESEAKLAVAEKNAVAAAKSSKENELKEYFEDKAIINTDIIKNYVKVYETAAEKKEDEVAIGKIDADTIVTVSQKGEKWTRVRAGNQKGWVRTKNLIFGDDAAKKVGTDAEFTVVTNEKVKIYKDTDMNSEVVATLKKEKSYDVKEKTENWLKVNTSDGDAYLRLHNVELKWTSKQAEAEKESKEAEAKKASEKAAKEESKKASEKAAKEESKKAAEQSKAAEESWLAESAAQAAAEEAARQAAAEEAARQAAAQAAAEEAARQAAAQ
ncbi:MAG: SH3 domain-containing protein, partial [Candidatus Fimimorpha sp.]